MINSLKELYEWMDNHSTSEDDFLRNECHQEELRPKTNGSKYVNGTQIFDKEN